MNLAKMQRCGLRYLAVGLVAGLVSGCERTARVEEDLAQMTQRALPSPARSPSVVNASPSPAPGPASAPRVPLTPAQARLILRNDGYLSALDRVSADAATTSDLRGTKAYHLLLDAAKMQQANDTAAKSNQPESGLPDLEKLTPDARQSLRADVEAELRDLTDTYLAAVCDHSIEETARAEAEFGAFAEDLRKTAGAGVIIPKEPFAMIPPPPPPVFEELIAGYEAQRDMTREWCVNHKKPALEKQLTFISQEIGRLKTIRESPERMKFVTERAAIFGKIKATPWAEITATRAGRVDTQMVKLRQALSARTGYREIRVAADAIRGPPSSVYEMIRDSLDEPNLNARRWLQSEARLEAFASKIAELPRIPDALKTPPADHNDLLAAELSDEQLERLRQIDADVLSRLSSAAAISDYRFKDRRAHTQRWANALHREAERRSAHAAGFTADDRVRITTLLGTYTPPPELPDEASKEAFLNLTDYRFPNRDAMPRSLYLEVGELLKESAAESMTEAQTLLTQYRQASDILARSTLPVSNDVLQRTREVRRDFQVAASYLERAIVQAQLYEADVHELKSQYAQFAAFLPANPAPLSQPVPVPTIRVRRDQPGLERALQNIREANASLRSELKGLDHLLAKVDITPRDFSKVKGRLTVNETGLRGVTDTFRNQDRDFGVERFASQWMGRLDEKQRPYPFADVKSPKQFKALGGGIHFGETAEPEKPADLKGGVLEYHAGEGLILRDPARGKRWVIAGPDVDPTTIKALYRFVCAERNAAISIGWGSERETITDVLRREQKNAVLLDPFLVDTAVGQDLVLADAIPWELDNPRLPNGAAVSFHDEFKRLKDDYLKPALAGLRQFVAGVAPYRPEDRQQWLARMKSETDDLPPLLSVLWSSEQRDEAAFQDFRQQELVSTRTALSRQFSKQLASDPQTVDVWRRASRQRRKEILQEILADYFTTQGINFDKEVEDDCRRRWEALPAGQEEARQIALESWLFDTLTKPESHNRAATECWVAQQHANHQPDDKIAEQLLGFSNPPTLAVLHDDKIVFRLEDDGKFRCQTTLTYFYGTSYVAVSEQHVGVSNDPHDPNRDVQPLTELGALVNAHIASLVASYPPLARIERYAGLAAFLRWAHTQGLTSGQLTFVDLSELGAYPANDGEHRPTPDFIVRGQ